MRRLDKSELSHIHGGDGKFKVVILADVSKECALFVANLYEQVLFGQLTPHEFYQHLLLSEYPHSELEKALDGLDILYYR